MIGIDQLMWTLLGVFFYLAFTSSQPLRATQKYTPFRINLQTAERPHLELLPGVGETTKKIVEYRKEHPLMQPDDLLSIHGIGQKTVDRLRWLVETEEHVENE